MNSIEKARKRYYYTGMAGYFLSGICAISISVIISLLQDHYGLSYGFMGTMVSAMSIGNMLSILTAGVLPGLIGERSTTLILGSGYFLGYLLITAAGQPAFILASFVLLGIARGLCTNKCTVLVGNHTDNRTRGITLMNSWWSVGALLCPFLIAGFGMFGAALHTSFLMQPAGLAAVGLLLWGLFFRARMPKGSFEEEEQAGDGLTDDAKAGNWKTGDGQTDDGQIGEVRAGNLQADEGKVCEARADNVRADNVRADNVRADNVRADNVRADNVQADEGKAGGAGGADRQVSALRYSFLRQPLFWLLTLLLFCDMGVELSVNGWLVSYYKSESILTGALSTYTVTIQWAAILIGRLMTAFVFKSKKIFRNIFFMSSTVLCTLFLMVTIRRPIPAIIALIIYSFAIGGIFPTAVSGIGELMNSQSVGIMLSLGSVSSILLPWLIGIAADNYGLRAGMMVILIPAAGVVLISLFIHRRQQGRLVP